MNTTLLLVLALAFACISCMGAVTAWLITRKPADKALAADVAELAILVERLAKAERRERMSRVRKGEKVGDEASAGFPVPPGAEGLTVEATPATSTVGFDKNALRRQVAQFRRS